MFDCLIYGDDLAVGVEYFLPECASHTELHLTSRDLMQLYNVRNNYDLTILSLSYNDINIDTEYNLRNVREKINGKVIWLLSDNYLDQYYDTIAVANEFGDSILFTTNYDHDFKTKLPTLKGFQKLKNDIVYLNSRL